MGAMASQITSLAIQCLLSRLFRHRSRKTSKLRVTGFCEGNSPVTSEFPAQRSSNTESHHAPEIPLKLSPSFIRPYHFVCQLMYFCPEHNCHSLEHREFIKRIYNWESSHKKNSCGTSFQDGSRVVIILWDCLKLTVRFRMLRISDI